MRTTRWSAAMLLALALVAAGCGSDDSAAGDGAADGTMAQDGHMHDTVAIDGAAVIPTVDLTVTPDTIKGWNVHAAVTGLSWAPEHAGLENVDGEGHAHLYVDGAKLTRLYGEWYHIESLPPGSHAIEVSLNANSHAGFMVGGEPVADTVIIDVPEPRDSDAGHMHSMDAAAPGPMTVAIRVEKDPMKGWNVLLDTTGFAWAPQHAGADPMPGEGHAHLYVDGAKVARVYGPAFYLADLAPGTHDVTVTLNANDHADYAYDGEAVTATATVTVDGVVAEPDVTVEVTVAGGAVTGGVERVAVATGDVVSITVTSDVAERLHVHGYDLYADVMAGMPTEVTFAASAAGVFEVELEEAGLPVLELEVRD